MGQVMNAPEEFVLALGGLPFIDGKFRPSLLLSVVAGVRRRFDPFAHDSLPDYLEPRNARDLFVRHGRSKVDEPACRPLSGLEHSKVKRAYEQIVSVRPDWAELLKLPVQLRRLGDSRVSLTSGLIPQVIFLGESAFLTPRVLAEVLVHEQAHVWLNLLAETSDLQASDAGEVYTLPSGTREKSVRGVLLAAHFAAASHAFYACHPGNESRLAYLHDYLTMCLNLLCYSKDVSLMGRCVMGRLHLYATDVQTRAPSAGEQ
jgi:hypothetical protein